jgi:hypothetical protein
MVKVGVYIFARAISEGGQIPEVIGWVGVTMATITLVYGFLMYLPQKDMKRLLAWSTISQLAWIFLALSMSIFGSKMAFNAGIVYIFNHAFAKSLFFLVAGALSYSCGTRMLPRLRGVMRTLLSPGSAFALRRSPLPVCRRSTVFSASSPVCRRVRPLRSAPHSARGDDPGAGGIGRQLRLVYLLVRARGAG